MPSARKQSVMSHANSSIPKGSRLIQLTALLCLAGGGAAWAGPQPSGIVTADYTQAMPESASGPDFVLAQPDAGAPRILLAKDKSDQLDVGDERPVGEQGIMRGKKDLFGKRRVESPPDNSMLDLGIMLCGGALVVLVIFAFAYRPAPKAAQQDY